MAAASTRTFRALVWTGPFMIVNLLAGMLLVHFIPPPSPARSAVSIATMFAHHRTLIVFGCVVMMFGWLCWATFCPAVMVMIRKAEAGRPVITYASIALIGAGMVFFEMIPLTWCVAAYRAGTISPEIIRTLNDWAWFNFLFSAPPFLVWFVLVAVAIFGDRREHPVYPKWVGYVNVWLAVIALPAMAIGFFKTGPLAWNGVLAFYIPVGAFVVWFAVMTVTTLRAIEADAAELAAAHLA
jgi:hypothetical protein